MPEHKTKVSTFFQAYPAREKGYDLSNDFREYLRQHHVEDLPHYLVRTHDGQLTLMNNAQSSILALFLAVYDRYESKGLRLLVDSNAQGWAVPKDKLKFPLTFTARRLGKYRIDDLLGRLEAIISETWAIDQTTMDSKTLWLLWQYEVAPHYRLDPIKEAVRAALAQWEAGNRAWGPIARSRFVAALSHDLDSYEPYRDRLLGVWLLNHLAAVHLTPKLSRSFSGQAIVPAFYGDVDNGGATPDVARFLGLDWTDRMTNPVEESQAAAILRSSDVTTIWYLFGGLHQAQITKLSKQFGALPSGYTPKYELSPITALPTNLIMAEVDEPGTITRAKNAPAIWPLRISGFNDKELTPSFVIRCIETAYLDNKKAIDAGHIADLMQMPAEPIDASWRTRWYESLK